MSESSELLRLVRETISSLDGENVKLSVSIRSCIRIARLRNDYINMFWLQWEIIDILNELERNRVLKEIIPHFTKDQFDYYNKKFIEMWLRERPGIEVKDDGKIENSDSPIAKSIFVIENDLEGIINTYKNAQTPFGMHPYDTAFFENKNILLRSQAQAYISHYEKILGDIKNRVFDFLSQTEKQLLYGQYHADIFEQNRKYVELRLNQVCPEALKELVSSIQRAQENSAEARAQALLSCRRLLKDFADILYPPTDQPFVGQDGKTHELSEEKYINRLWQFIMEKAHLTTSTKLLQSSLNDLGSRLDKIYDLASKGVHSEVEVFEMNQCLIQTYLLVGDLLRIYDNQSALSEHSGA